MTGTVSFIGDKPMKIDKQTDDSTFVLETEQQHTIEVVGETVEAYRKALKAHLSGKSCLHAPAASPAVSHEAALRGQGTRGSETCRHD